MKQRKGFADFFVRLQREQVHNALNSCVAMFVTECEECMCGCVCERLNMFVFS